MDTNKWKSVLVPRDIYIRIKETALAEGRTISGQLRVMYESYLKDYETRPKDQRFDN